MATEVGSPSQLPQLQSLQKALALPTVEAAVEQVGALYSRVKGAHTLLEWALSTAEMSVSLVAHTAAPYVAAPLAVGDKKVTAALENLEKRVPLVTESPKVILETTKQAVMSRISPHVNKVYTARNVAEQRVKSLKDLSYAKANSLLSTAYGQKAMISVDNGASYAMQLLDYYLPQVGVQTEQNVEIVAANEDPVRHTMQTVGRLSSVAARRVWANMALKINDLRNSGIDMDFRRYVTALLDALHLAKITSQEQLAEAEKQQQQNNQQEKEIAATQPAASAQAPTNNVSQSAPTTAKKVKTTPEGKSKPKNNSSNPNNST